MEETDLFDVGKKIVTDGDDPLTKHIHPSIMAVKKERKYLTPKQHIRQKVFIDI